MRICIVTGASGVTEVDKGFLDTDTSETPIDIYTPVTINNKSISRSALYTSSDAWNTGAIYGYLLFSQPTTVTLKINNSVRVTAVAQLYDNRVYGVYLYYTTTGSDLYKCRESVVPFYHDESTQTGTHYQEFLNYVTEPVPMPYVWESVSSIIGKDKTYRLTDILNINDGEAVDDVALSGNISLSANSALDVLIDAVVTVSYSIPDETYSYIKLVYKKDRMPTSPTDGTAIDIAQSSTSQVISGIADGSTYWFVIFTDISESDPVSFDTLRTG